MTPDALPRELDAALPAGGDALFITRHNLGLAGRLRALAPSVRWTVLTKDDLTGHGARTLLRRIRERRWELALIEDQAAEAVRRLDLYRGILLAASARRRGILWGDPHVYRPVRLLTDAPALLGSLLAEIGTGLLALAEAALLLLTVRPRPRRAIPDARSVMYLRTEFWFGVKAGGSVSHSHGFLGGVRDLGKEASWVAIDPPAEVPEGVRVEVVPPPRRPAILEELAMVRANRVQAARIKERFGSAPPDVVVHRHSVFSLAGALAARALDRPLVLEVNASEVWARRAWSRLRFARLAEAMERRALASADRVTVVSRVLAGQIEALGVDPDRIVVNPNGVDVRRFDPRAGGREERARLDVPPEAVVVSFLGTFTRWHGVLFLAEQVAALAEADPSLLFLFLGDGDLRSAVEQRVARDGVAGRCRFPGLQAPAAVPGYLAASDILVSPHLPFEDGSPFFGSPTKLFEYLAAGRAVVGSRLGQIGDVIRDGENGLLFEPGDGAGFRDAVLRLAGDRGLRERLGRAARRTAETEYTWRANAERAVGPDVAGPGPGGAQ